MEWLLKKLGPWFFVVIFCLVSLIAILSHRGMPDIGIGEYSTAVTVKLLDMNFWHLFTLVLIHAYLVRGGKW